MAIKKERVHQLCLELVETKIHRLNNEFKALSNSASSDTKSSMGDKYETSREMINLEKAKISEQLHNMRAMLLTLKGIDPNRSQSKAELGALVSTQMAIYYLSTALGQITLDEQVVFCISMGSPIAQQMLSKKAGDQFQMGPKKQEILEVM